MAKNNEFRVSYVRITEEGLERHNDVLLKDVTSEDRKDIKSLIFLPVNTDRMYDVTDVVKGFPILESVYLPSMMTTSMSALVKECPMIMSLVLLSQGTEGNSLDECVVKVNAHEEEGDNTAEFRTFVTTTKDGKQTFQVNSRQVLSHELVIEEKIVERLTLDQVREAISGENGVIATLDAINSEIEDERCRIDITEETLESLFGIFVEKGVTFEEFSIDFSKMCDKIESYKTIVKSVNQVTIKEDVEGNIVETYQNILQLHYDNLLKELSTIGAKLVAGTTLDTEESLVVDLKTRIANVVVDNPSFDEDYKEGDTLDTILSDIPTAVSRNIRTSRERGLLRKYLAQAVSQLKTDKEGLYSLIEAKLKERASIEWVRARFAKTFGLDLEKKQQAKLVDKIVTILTPKNFGTMTKDDVRGIIKRIQKEMGNGEVRSKEMLEIISRVSSDYPTKEEINNVLVDFIEGNGYSSIKLD